MDDIKEMKDLVNGLGLPDDLPEVLADRNQQPDAATAARIKARTLRLADSDRPLRRSPSRASRMRLWYAAAAAAVLLTLPVTVKPVGAAVKQLLSYVPGFGLRAPSTVSLAAAQAVRVKRDGVEVEVKGLVADTKGIAVNFTIDGPLRVMPQDPYLEDEQGQKYPSAGGSVASAGNSTTQTSRAYIGFKGTLPAGTKQVTLVLPADPEWRLVIPLMPASGLTTAEQFGPSVTANGITVSAQVAAEADRTSVTLLLQGVPQGSLPASIGRNFGNLPATARAVLTGPGGGDYGLRTANFAGSRDLWQMSADPIPAGVDTVTLSIPVIQMQEDAQGTFSVPVPPAGAPRELNLPVKVGRWTITATRAEIDENGQLRVHVDPGPAGASTLTGLHGLTVNGRLGSWSAEYDRATGRIQWFTIPLPKGREAKITIQGVVVDVTGPWTVAVPVGRR